MNIDSHKLHFHPDRVSLWLHGKDSWETAKYIYPIYVEVAPIGACNHRCTFCSVDYIGYTSKSIDVKTFSELFREFKKLGVKSVMLAGEGEPLIHKNIGEITRSCINSGLDVSFTTNGVLLEKISLDGVSWVKVSLNAGTRQTYEKVHKAKGRDFDKVISNLHQDKFNSTMGVQMVVLPENVGEIHELAKICRSANVDYLVLKPYTQSVFSPNRVYNSVNYTLMMDEINSQVEKSKGLVEIHTRHASMKQKDDNHSYDKCNATPYFWAYIMASGDVYTCGAYLLDERFNIGNIYEQSFHTIWTGEKRRKNWELLKTLDLSTCRKNCRMDKVNKYLWEFDHAKHVNFI